MVSIKKIEAKRQNALKSTGKGLSSQILIKPGVFSRKALLPGEDTEELNQVKRPDAGSFEPGGSR